MANSVGYHESEGKLRPETLDNHRALTSMQEELEAADWYDQRVDAATDQDLKDILAHNRDEEKEHFAMLLEWYRRRDAKMDAHLKEYLFTYRNLGIFQENIVNQVLDDVVKACNPIWAKVVGDFRPRGGISTIVEAFHPRPQASKGPKN